MSAQRHVLRLILLHALRVPLGLTGAIGLKRGGALQLVRLLGGDAHVIYPSDQNDPTSGSNRPPLQITETTAESRSIKADDLKQSFEAFYRRYPRKEARADAEKAWPTALEECGDLDTQWYTGNYEQPILSDQDANPASPKSAQGLRGQDANHASSSIKQRLRTEITPEIWDDWLGEFWKAYPKKMLRTMCGRRDKQR